MNYDDVLQILFHRVTAGIKLGIATSQALLQALQNPERAYRCVLVAGTNGKGSTSALLAAALARQGLKVGLFTSPHLLSFTERIAIDGAPVSQEEIVSLFEAIETASARAGCKPTFFESATAMAALAFARAKVEVAVFEVGLGGRLDATNAIPRDLSVITRIGLDHQHLLGDTLADIAAEKAGIIAPGIPVVVGAQDPQAGAVLARVAHERGAEVFPAEPETSVPTHLAPYQKENVGVARRAARLMGVTHEVFEHTLAQFQWPGRYMWVKGQPPLLLDGAHNPQGVEAFCRALQSDARATGRPMAGIFSAVATKDVANMTRCLQHLPIPWHVCPTASARTLSCEALRQHLPEAIPCTNAAAALAQARQQVGAQGLVVGVGSLFLVADLLRQVQDAAPEPAFDG